MSPFRLHSPLLRQVVPPVLGLGLGLLASVSSLHATLSQHWPRFNPATTIEDVNVVGATDEDLLAATTLQGAYNKQNGATRLYLTTEGGTTYDYDTFWLHQGFPSSMIQEMGFNGLTPLQAMLQQYVAGTSLASKGYIVYDPTIPETVNYATTLAGAYGCMVIGADQETEAYMYGGLSVHSGGVQCDLTQVDWIGSNQALVGNTTINHVGNPGGNGNTTGWSTVNGGTLTNTSTELKFTVPANSNLCWAKYTPTGIDNSDDNHYYVFSVQVNGTSGSNQVYLDAWNGVTDVVSGPVTLSGTNKTLQVGTVIPKYGTPTTISVRVKPSSTAATVYFLNAAVVRDHVAVETTAYNTANAGTISVSNLATASIPDQPVGSVFYESNLRDYLVAGNVFTFTLSSTNADEVALYANVLNLNPGNTVVLGYPSNLGDEKADVAYLSGSGQSLQNHWMNASDAYRNASVFTALPELTSMTQLRPPSIVGAKHDKYVYVATEVSDGDNITFLQKTRKDDVTKSQYPGAVPEGWTLNPGGLEYSPQMTSYFYEVLPQSGEIMAGPSGVGYITDMDSVTPLANFTNFTHEFMVAGAMTSVTTWESSSSQYTAFADDLNADGYVTNVISRSPESPLQTIINGNGLLLQGQDITYFNGADDTPAELVNAIIAAAKANYVSGDNTYVQVMRSGSYTADDYLYVAQQVQAQDTNGFTYFFVTPSELADIKRGKGTASSSPQAIQASELSVVYPMNLIVNGSGQDPTNTTTWANNGGGCPGWGIPDTVNVANGNLTLGIYTYNFTPALVFNVAASVDEKEYVTNGPKNIIGGDSYDYSVDVAGTGLAYLDASDGAGNHYSPTVSLTSSYQTLALPNTVAGATGPYTIEVRVPSSTSASTVYIRNASVTAHKAPDFYTGVETTPTMDPSLSYTTPTVDPTTDGGGGESGISSYQLQLDTTMSFGGANSLQYGGQVSSAGGHSYVYLEAFDLSGGTGSAGSPITLVSGSGGNTRLSYRIFPQSPKGLEPDVNLTTGLDSTAVAVDLLFSDGTALHSDASIVDQYGNQMAPFGQLTHLMPDQWNYVTCDLSSLANGTRQIVRIDIGFSEPNANPNAQYRGYVDNITVTH